ncbi:hypothetical protein JAAARDRAFT_128099 [Jaapia argillacea MUCL 33604]|uniref:BTB domain-containing protein n=1 Tax=Jaapia argillacea MUCL 33604 TaxID=933084 RepID=A0A067Q6J7_9AGAM|nr:hypothetical protein JAAARDRAFT_128099 [Jaapia argillacea MUCL 33604]
MPFSSVLSPIILEDVTVVDFERFLSALYPSELDKTDASTVEEWTSILHLSTKFSFASIRRLAIRSIFPIASSIDKIVLANKYDIEGTEWKRDAYVDVCQRKEALTLEEGERLGMSEVIKIARVRQEEGSLPTEMRGQLVKWIQEQFGFGADEEEVEQPEIKVEEIERVEAISCQAHEPEKPEEICAQEPAAVSPPVQRPSPFDRRRQGPMGQPRKAW